MRLEILLFGKFEVRRDGHPLPPTVWKNTKTQALLKILAGERGRVFLVDELVEYLWPGEELNLKSASSNLRNRVAELRKILEPELARGETSRYIRSQQGGYALSAESDGWVDIEECTRYEEAGRRQQREGRLDEALQTLEKAISLYRGDYLAEDRYAEWALQLRERWRERYVEILSELANCLSRRGRYREALRYVERALAKAPLYETLYRQAMVYAFCAGDIAQARRAYERCRAVLEREMGERPSSQTEEIYKQIQQGHIPDVGQRYPQIEPERLVALPAKLQRLPFSGRQQEWPHLQTALQKTQSNQGIVMFIWGEPGVGKTRLCEEFLAQAQEKLHAQILKGRCLEMKNPLPLHPWLEALYPTVAQLTAESLNQVQLSWLAECAELLPSLRLAIPHLPETVSLPSEHRPYRLFETFYQILQALARQRAPLLILLDDLHWTDEDTLDLLSYVMNKWASLPLLILGTARLGDAPSQQRLANLQHQAARRGWLEELRLENLAPSDIEEIIAQLGDELATPAEAGERLYRESAGNPFFVSAILQSLFENGAFVSEGARWRLSDMAQVRLPLPAMELIEHRLARMGAAAQRVLKIVACAVQIELEVLERAWEGTSEELFAHLPELVAQGLLTERQGRYEFTHDKFREVVYNSLEEPGKIWLHRRLAQALEQTYPDPAAVGLAGQIAEHYEHGGQPAKALEWILQAIEVCHKQYRNDEGSQLVGRGLRLLERLEVRLSDHEQTERKFNLLHRRAEFHLRSGQLEVAESDLKELFEIVGQSSDELKQAQIHYLHALWKRQQGEYEGALNTAQRARLIYQFAGKRKGEGDSLYQMGVAHFYLGRYQEALRCFQEAHAIYQELQDEQWQADALMSIGNTYGALGNCHTALDYHRQALKLASKSRDISMESYLLSNIGLVHWRTGNYQEALKHFKQGLELAAKIGDRFWVAMTMRNLGEIYLLIGFYQQALQLFSQAQATFVELGREAFQGQSLWHLGIVYRCLGEREQAITHFEEALKICRRLEDRVEEAWCLEAYAESYLIWNDPEQALTALKQALEISQNLEISDLMARCWSDLSEAYLQQGQPQEALGACEKALQLLKEGEIHKETLVQTHWRYFQVQRVLGLEKEALIALHEARDGLLQMAQQIEDESLKTSFLVIPWHQEILAAAQAHGLLQNVPQNENPE